MSRRIFIGDIQGCRTELETLLETLRFDPGSDRLHPVGDLVNRGPDSLGTLRLLQQLDARAVLGNHDLHLLRVARGLRTRSESDTFDEVLAASDRETLLAWLASLPFLRATPELYQVHAGLHPRWSDPERVLAGLDPLIPHPDVAFATRVRECTASGAWREEEAPAEARRPWFEFYDAESHGGRTVVFGHWAARGLVEAPHLRGLDSGCVWGGKLTAWIDEEDRIVQVDARRAYAHIR